MVIIDEKFISLSDLSKISGYTRDHLGLLIRKGVLYGVKVGKNYLCDIKSFENYLLSDKCNKFSRDQKLSIIKKINSLPQLSVGRNSDDFTNTKLFQALKIKKAIYPLLVFGLIIFITSILLFYKNPNSHYTNQNSNPYIGAKGGFNLDGDNYIPLIIKIK